MAGGRPPATGSLLVLMENSRLAQHSARRVETRPIAIAESAAGW